MCTLGTPRRGLNSQPLTIGACRGRKTAHQLRSRPRQTMTEEDEAVGFLAHQHQRVPGFALRVVLRVAERAPRTPCAAPRPRSPAGSTRKTGWRCRARSRGCCPTAAFEDAWRRNSASSRDDFTACRTVRRVCGETRSGRLSARDTVAVETPARLATSLMLDTIPPLRCEAPMLAGMPTSTRQNRSGRR